MSFEYLDNESERLLREILELKELPKSTLRGEAIDYLVKNDYLDGKCTTTLSDSGSCYIVTAIRQKGKTYFEMRQKYEKEQKRLSHREWKIAIISAILGAVIGLIPSIVQFFSCQLSHT